MSAKIYRDHLPIAESARESDALHGGEEYELIIVAPELPPEIEGTSVTRIGAIVAATGEPQVVLVDLVGGLAESVLQPRGWDHYSA